MAGDPICFVHGMTPCNCRNGDVTREDQHRFLLNDMRRTYADTERPFDARPENISRVFRELANAVESVAAGETAIFIGWTQLRALADAVERQSTLPIHTPNFENPKVPTVDISPENIARALLALAQETDKPDKAKHGYGFPCIEAYAMADALKQLALSRATAMRDMPWTERVKRAAIHRRVRYYEPCSCDINTPNDPCTYCLQLAESALRSGFPEMAPHP